MYGQHRVTFSAHIVGDGDKRWGYSLKGGKSNPIGKRLMLMKHRIKFPIKKALRSLQGACPTNRRLSAR